MDQLDRLRPAGVAVGHEQPGGRQALSQLPARLAQLGSPCHAPHRGADLGGPDQLDEQPPNEELAVLAWRPLAASAGSPGRATG